MPVNTPHRSLTEALPKWSIVRHTFDGPMAVKAAGKTYLPTLADQENEDYHRYVQRAVFFNCVKRTALAVTGFLFRKPPTVKTSVPPAVLEDADLSGNPLAEYAKVAGTEIVTVGRCGTLIDWSNDLSRPYLALFCAENILNWRTSRQVIGGKVVKSLDILVLREWREEVVTDEFAPGLVETFRVYRRTEQGVACSVYKAKSATTITANRTAEGTGPGPTATDGTGGFDLIESSIMKRRGAPLTEIPFVFHNAAQAGAEIGDVPLYDVAELNVAHYRNSADLENGRHMCGVPTPYAVGFESSDKLYLGCNYAWTSANADAKAGFIEVSGAGLATLENALKEKTEQMAALGARMIEPPRADAEAYETHALRATAETSSVATMATQLSNSMSEVLTWLEYWVGNGERTMSASFAVSRDFIVADMPPEKLNALMAMWLQGAISYATLFHNLRKGEVMRPDVTEEEERGEIEANPPMPTPATNPTPPIDPNKTPPKPKPPAK